MNNFVKQFFKGDAGIWVIIVCLSLISILAVYSSTGNLAFKYQDGNTGYYAQKHISFLVLGFVIITAAHHVHYRHFISFFTWLLPVSVILLVLTLFVGDSINDASRWLTIPGLKLSFQPSELAKLSLIVYVARRLYYSQSGEHPPREAFRPIMIWTCIVCGLIVTEDLSTALLIGIVIMLMMFVGRVPLKYLFATLGAGIALFALVLLISPQFDNVGAFHRANVWRTRLVTHSDGEKADSDASYQSDQAKIAVATGGLIGSFFGESRQSNYLPHPYSDFIYAIIIEKGGFIFGFLTIWLYILLFYRSILAAMRCRSTITLFLITGIAGALVLQAFVHIFVCLGLFPVTGQTLPFVSMGGTSILLTSLSLGIILSVTRYGMPPKGEENDDRFEPAEMID